MFRTDFARTGIDLGSSCVKIVRGTGTTSLSEVTHVGFEPWEGDGSEKDVEKAAGALRDLLDRLHLNRTRLGRVAVSVGGGDTCLREVTMPPLTPEEFADWSDERILAEVSRRLRECWEQARVAISGKRPPD